MKNNLLKVFVCFLAIASPGLTTGEGVCVVPYEPQGGDSPTTGSGSQGDCGCKKLSTGASKSSQQTLPGGGGGSAAQFGCTT
jgi:hypothetical protein